MSIVASIIIEDSPQIDGRRWITERHTDHVGKTHFITYIAGLLDNVTTTMTARVSQIETSLENQEIEENMDRATGDGPVDIKLVYSTVLQNRNRLREIYRTASAWQLVRIGWYINSLGLSNAQLGGLFGVSGAQLTALRTKLANLATKYTDVIAQIGN